MPQKLTFRPVEEDDCELIFNWANDPFTRENSFNTESINWDEHIIWFANKLRTDNCLFYIFFYNEKAVGQVRIDISNDEGVINFSVDRQFRRHGYGTTMLEILPDIVEGVRPGTRLTGTVKADNQASIKAFERAGYKILRTTKENESKTITFQYSI
ncbi:MAG: GNAT family N-acetyltransferase [Bacteroidetes bacterium]|nr:GNAT family N-acetyltransferase [Bacteroidota bacterium]